MSFIHMYKRKTIYDNGTCTYLVSRQQLKEQLGTSLRHVSSCKHRYIQTVTSSGTPFIYVIYLNSFIYWAKHTNPPNTFITVYIFFISRCSAKAYVFSCYNVQRRQRVMLEPNLERDAGILMNSNGICRRHSTTERMLSLFVMLTKNTHIFACNEVGRR